MAEYLASIFGTEKDKVNCSFYFKIGACRHGERCSRLHNKPTFSQTVLLQNLYLNPQNAALTADGSHSKTGSLSPADSGFSMPSNLMVDDVEAQQQFDDFFEEVFTELEDKLDDFEIQQHYDEFFEEVYVEMEKYGEIEEMNICDNLGDHLVGNVYVKFRREEDADKAVADLNNRWFNGRPVNAELSPVTDFREACCRQYEMGECTRGGFCNFMHLKPISRELRRELYGRRKKSSSRRSRSKSPRSGGISAGISNKSRSRSRDRRDRKNKSRSRSREKRGGRSRSRDRHGRY